jgi:hypothetical protein
MNITSYLLIAIAVAVLSYDLGVAVAGRIDLTISESIRATGPWAGLLYLFAGAFIIWHLWIQPYEW